MYKVEDILPYMDNEEQPKSIQIEKMFDEIAPKYDLLNHTMSLNLDKGWRRQAIKIISEINPKSILDVATGTGDLAIEAYRMLMPEKILGIDISEQMMEIARAKTDKLGLGNKIHFDRQNCCCLTLDNDSFDAVMVAFGIRNFENLDKGLQEMFRVLRPNGRLVILELTTPDTFPAKQGYCLYSKLIPLLGKLFAKNKSAYNYLPKSISAFPQNREMVEIMKKNGFTNVSFKSLSLGTCSIYTGNK